VIIKEISHKTPKSSGKAKAQAKKEERQASRVVGGIAKSVGGAVVSALSKSAKGGKAAPPVQPRSVGATLEYVIRGDDGADRGELIYSQKLDMLEPEMITVAMESTASMNQSVKNPCKHFVISWAEGEKPTRDQMTKSIATYLRGAGFEEHQAAAYLHTDTDVVHVHIIANQVHPETYKSVNDKFFRSKADYKIRERIARQLEEENGWKRVEGKLHKTDNDGILVERTYEEKILFSQERSDRVSDRSLRQEKYSGKPSFERWCKQGKESERLREDVKKVIIGGNVGWNDIHKILEKYNVGIKPDKNLRGLIVYDIHDADKCFTAASGLSRELSAGNLSKIINTPYLPFVPTAQSASVTPLPLKENKPSPSKPAFPSVSAGPREPPPAMTITGRASAIARQYADHATRITATDPAKAKVLKDAAAILRKQPDSPDMTLPLPSAPVAEIGTAMKGIGGRKR
jgi:hypothetical protein